MTTPHNSAELAFSADALEASASAEGAVADVVAIADRLTGLTHQIDAPQEGIDAEAEAEIFAFPTSYSDETAPVLDEVDLTGVETEDPTEILKVLPELDLTPGAEQNLDLVRVYLNSIAQVPRISDSTVIHLAKQKDAGSEAAKQRMVDANLRLSANIAKRYLGLGLPYLDLVQEGNIGLMRAVEKFDWKKGFTMSTYATLWIRQSILRGIDKRSRSIVIPVERRIQERKVTRALSKLHSVLGREATSKEIAIQTDLEEDDVDIALTLPVVATSLDKPVGEDGEVTFADLIVGEDGSKGHETAVQNEEFRIIKRALTRLGINPRNQSIFFNLHGLGGLVAGSQKAVGKQHKLSARRVQDINQEIIYKLVRDAEFKQSIGED